jgi:type I restriction enzyme, S subunit
MPENLKKGWTRVAFGDVVQLCRDRSSKPAEEGFDRYVGLEHLEPSELKIRRWGNVADGTTFTNVFRTGQVLFGKRRAYQRKVAVADFEGVCSGDIYVLEPKNENMLPGLLPFICQTDGFFEHAVGTSAGSLSPRTNWKSLVSYEFVLPPIEEQRRISTLLNSIEEYRIAHDKCFRLLCRTRSALIASFLCKLQAQGDNLRRTTGVTTLTKLCRVRTGKLDSNAAVQVGEFPFFTCDPDPKIIDVHAFDCEAVLLPGNNAQGNFWVKTYRGKFNAYQRTYVLEPDFSLARLEYVAIFLEHKLEDLRNLSMGSTTKYLTMDLLSKFEVPIPPLAVQDDLVSSVSMMDRRIHESSLRAKSLVALSGAVLKGLDGRKA